LMMLLMLDIANVPFLPGIQRRSAYFFRSSRLNIY